MAELNRQTWQLTEGQAAELRTTLAQMTEQRYVPRIWEPDASLWRPEPEQQAEIKSRLGWLTVPEQCLEQVGRLTDFVTQVRRDGFEHTVVLGMGGSSLAPWSFERMFGPAYGYPSLAVLDSTVPQEVLAAWGCAAPEQTLFIVSSKSGTTTEVLSFFEYFYAEMTHSQGEAAAGNFVVITDPDTPLARAGYQRGVRAVFENWPEIGGRFSALSYFGMVPAALLGLPVGDLLDGAAAMAEACRPTVALQHNPGAQLGALLGACQALGRDKITFLASPILASFGDWIEQLLAESTGKQGTGLIPVVGEPAGEVSAYAEDRVFVHMHLADDERLAPLLAGLADAGHPVLDIEVADLVSIGQEIFRWEFATVVAGALLGINPFDQPNVQESKDKTREMLAAYSRDGRLPESTPDAAQAGLVVYGAPGAASVEAALAGLLNQTEPGDYVALMAYLPRTEDTDRTLTQLRTYLRDTFRIATTVGYGPRFLHSTGQLHKGGPNTAVLLQLGGQDHPCVPVPGQDYDFATLMQAQAWGDFAVLRDRGRRVLRLDLDSDVEKALAGLAELIRGI